MNIDKLICVFSGGSLSFCVFQESEEDLAEAAEYVEARTILDSVMVEG